MSYSIIYDKAFIKTTRGIIPLILCGSSNCSERINGRWVREREWFVYNNNLLELKEQEFMKKIREMFARYDPNDQLFQWKSKWLHASQIEAWFQRGIKSARPIEDILHINPGVSLRACVNVYNRDDSCKSKNILDSFPKTTDELEQWISEACEMVRMQSSDKTCASIHIGFTSQVPLKHLSPITSEPVVAKIRNQYVEEVCENQICYSPNPKNAIVFASTKEAEEKIGKWAKCFNVQYVKYSTVCAPKPFAIQVAGGSRAGYFIVKKTARRIFFTTNAKDARRFPTRQRAIAAIQDLFEFTDSIGPLTVFEIK